MSRNTRTTSGGAGRALRQRCHNSVSPANQYTSRPTAAARKATTSSSVGENHARVGSACGIGAGADAGAESIGDAAGGVLAGSMVSSSSFGASGATLNPTGTAVDRAGWLVEATGVSGAGVS